MKAELSNDRETQSGLAVRRKALGDAYVDAALAKSTAVHRSAAGTDNEACLRKRWQLGGLDLRTRGIVTAAMLMGLGKMDELKTHERSAQNNGMTPEEVQEIFLHASLCCGFPASLDVICVSSKAIDGCTETSA